MKVKSLFIPTVLIFVLSSCSVKKNISLPYQSIADQIKNSPVNQQHQVGFVIRELGSDKNMFEENASKYFTPASNTKLFTFYTALNMLGDSIPSFEYVMKKDSLIIWPMADASFLHPDFKEQKAFDFLKNAGKNIYLVNGRYLGDRFGAGWSWDDYNDYYQAEITELPLYGNSMNIAASGDGILKYAPNLPNLYLSEVVSSKGITKILRNPVNNNLTVPTTVGANYKQTIPLSLNENVVENLLTDTLLSTGMIIKPVMNIDWRAVPAKAKVIYSSPADSLYKHMLQPSDNFIAEELLLNCAAANHLKMRTDSVISFSTRKYLSDLPDKVQWVDGSGLSRLNLFTPNDMAKLLQKIYQKVGDEKRLFGLLATGGSSGTLRNMFKTSGAPYVFAKSGSLSNNYNLSGYLIGKSGKRYIFSFMNNNYINSTAEIRAEVERVIAFIHDNY